MIMFAAIGAVLVLAILGVTLVVVRSRGKSDDGQDTVQQFGGVSKWILSKHMYNRWLVKAMMRLLRGNMLSSIMQHIMLSKGKAAATE